MFENHIIQIIIDGVKQKEHSNALNVIRIQLDLNIRTDLNSMSLEDLAKIHENIVKAEKDIQVIDNFYKFYRALLYLTAHNKCEETQFLKWIKTPRCQQSHGISLYGFCCNYHEIAWTDSVGSKF